MGIEHDIDLSGDFDLTTTELPPGVAPGQLQGDDGAPPEETQPVDVVDPEVEPADVPWDGVIREGSLGGDDPEEGDPATSEAPEPDEYEIVGEEALAALEAEEAEAELVASEGVDPTREPPEGTQFLTSSTEVLGDIPPEEPETPVETPAEEEPTAAPKKKRAARKKKALPVAPRAKGGPVDRLYVIHRMVEAEVDGQVVEVAVKVAFADPDDEKTIIQGIRARNRDLALARALRAFGVGWRGTLVATPEGYWEPEEFFNEPTGGFTPTKVGG